MTVLPAAHRPLSSNGSEELSVSLPDNLLALPAGQAAAWGYSCSTTSGLVTLPVDATPDLTYAWLEVRCPLAACLMAVASNTACAERA